MISLELHANGVVLPVRATASARQNAVTGQHAGMLKVSVSQAPEKGKANQAIVAVLCDSLDLKKSQLQLLSGETNPIKRFLVRGVSQAELIDRLSRWS
jgi:uncharacterized protein YggU (UPF0235/DUF167 family)